MRPLLLTTLFLAACNSSSAAAPAASAPAAGKAEAIATADGKTKVAIRVTKDGFEPKEVKVPQGKPVVLEFTRETESECLNAVRMPWLTETIALPLDKPVAIPFDAGKVGTVTYSCWMNMVFGKLTVTPS
jgi:plastocyanin domain-containing protein